MQDGSDLARIRREELDSPIACTGYNPEAESYPYLMGQVPRWRKCLPRTELPGSVSIFERASLAPGLAERDVRVSCCPETEEYGMCRDTYQARRTFQPQRFFSFR